MENNIGLNHTEIQSTRASIAPFVLETSEDLYSVLEKAGLDTAHSILYLDHALAIGRWNGQEFTTDAGEPFPGEDIQHLQQARIFNSTMEAFFWKIGERQFQGRVRTDGTGDPVSVVEVRQFVKPISVTSADATKILHRLHVRNYIGYSANQLAGYVDNRLMALIDTAENEILP